MLKPAKFFHLSLISARVMLPAWPANIRPAWKSCRGQTVQLILPQHQKQSNNIDTSWRPFSSKTLLKKYHFMGSAFLRKVAEVRRRGRRRPPSRRTAAAGSPREPVAPVFWLRSSKRRGTLAEWGSRFENRVRRSGLASQEVPGLRADREVLERVARRSAPDWKGKRKLDLGNLNRRGKFDK